MTFSDLRGAVSTAQGAKVAQLLALEQYRAQRAHLFPSLSSLQWWMRTHRRQAIEAGALLLVRGRYHVNPEKMDACIAAAGQEAALRQLASA